MDADVTYSIEVRMQHSSTFGVPLDEGDVVIGYHARIVATTDDGEARVGAASAHLIRLGLALDHELDALSACDAVSAKLYDIAEAALDPDTGQLSDEVHDQLEYVGGDLLIIEHVEIEPGHRGQDLGLAVVDRLIDLLAPAMVLCRPVADGASATGTRRLEWYAQHLGFAPLRGSDVYALSTAIRRPAVRLRGRS